MKINSIQYLRAIAALLVVYCHAIDNQIQLGISWQQQFRYLQNFGAIGVDIFFVISGFIISHISSKKETGITESLHFLQKRFLRINPSYYIATIIGIYIYARQVPGFSISNVTILNSITIFPVFGGNLPWLGVAWTLIFEWFFYLLFACLIFFNVKRKELAMVLVLAVLTLCSFIPNKNEPVIIVTNPMLWEFCIGIFIAFCYKEYKVKRSLAAFLFILAIVMYVLLIYFGYSGVSESTYIMKGEQCWLRVLLWGIPSGMLVFGFLFLEQSGTFVLKNKVLLLLGNASFAIYLMHTTVLGYLKGLLSNHKEILKLLPIDLWVFVIMTIATLIGILYYWIVEKNLNRLFQTPQKKKRAFHTA